MAPTLLAVVEYFAHNRFKPVYEAAGFAVHSEFMLRKAIAWLRKNEPVWVVADFYIQTDFRDRVSNLESLLATLQSREGVRTIVLYDPAHQHALDKLRQRFLIDHALTMPVSEAALGEILANA